MGCQCSIPFQKQQPKVTDWGCVIHPSLSKCVMCNLTCNIRFLLFLLFFFYPSRYAVQGLGFNTKSSLWPQIVWDRNSITALLVLFISKVMILSMIRISCQSETEVSSLFLITVVIARLGTQSDKVSQENRIK